jgi:oligopeptide/dipeptide ABC transporter ATP-binding protein
MTKKETLMTVKDLTVTYYTRLGPVSAVDHVSFEMYKGEILGLVGESGCGKSTMGKALLRMIPPPAVVSASSYIFDGMDVMKFNQKQLRDFRGRRVTMIFQDPMTSLNPVQRVDDHLFEAIQVHEKKTKKSQAMPRVSAMIERLGIQKQRLASYPHQLSGGMRQRVMIGLGLILNASLIIADEATTSLDVIVEAKLVDQLRDIRDQYGVAILTISHNIALIAEIADRIAVMYAGQIVELGEIKDVFKKPLHPYTQGLLASVPNIKLDEREELYKMGGEPPNLSHPPDGCRFHPRCPKVMPICKKQQPDFLAAAKDQQVMCWLYQDHKQTKSVKAEA